MTNKIVTYMVGKSKKSVKLTEAQANEIIRRRDEHPEKLVSLGSDTVMGKAIVAIQAEIEGVINKEKVKALRTSLKNAALNCHACNSYGWQEVFMKDGQIIAKWEPLCEIALAPCQCQKKVKTQYGLAENDLTWSSLDSKD